MTRCGRALYIVMTRPGREWLPAPMVGGADAVHPLEGDAQGVGVGVADLAGRGLDGGVGLPQQVGGEAEAPAGQVGAGAPLG